MENLDKLVVHTFPGGRGIPVVWLIRSLGLPHEIVGHVRQPRQAGECPPAELAKLCSIGHLPMVEVQFKDGTSRVLAELGYILEYIIRHFDPENKMSGKTPNDKEDVLFFLHLGEGSLMPSIVPEVIVKMMKCENNHAYFQGYLPRFRHDLFAFMNEWCEKQFKAGNSYLVGNDLTAADLATIGVCVMNQEELPKYPSMAKWAAVIQARQDGQEAKKEEAAAPIK